MSLEIYKSQVNFTYPSKILVAWAEAIGGNTKIREWLIKNGYAELGIFVFALRNKEDAKQWLFDNGFQHLAATINGAEGNPNAVNWLKKYGFEPLACVARSGDGDEEALKWLIRHGHKELAMIGKKIELVKDEIERDNNDIHKISKE